MRFRLLMCSTAALLAFGEPATAGDVPASGPYCGGDKIKRRLSFVLISKPSDQWDARVTVDGRELKAMTSYSFFGKAQPPAGFVVALLGEDRSEILVFSKDGTDWLEFGDYKYSKCD